MKEIRKENNQKLLSDIKEQLKKVNLQLETYAANKEYGSRKDVKFNKMINFTLIGTSFILMAFGITQIKDELLNYLALNYILTIISIPLIIGFLFLIISLVIGFRSYLRSRKIAGTSEK